MQYPGSGPGWRMQRPPRGPPRGGDFGPRFGPPRSCFGPTPPHPPWAFRGRGGGGPFRFRGPRPPPPHWFMEQQQFQAPGSQNVSLEVENPIVPDPVEVGAAQRNPQVRRGEI